MRISTKINRLLLLPINVMGLRNLYEKTIPAVYFVLETIGMGTEQWKFNDYDISFKIKTRFRSSFNAFNEEGYCADSKQEIDAFMKLAQDKKTFLDVGALYGVFSLSFSAIDQTKKSFAIEASSDAYEGLKQHVDLNPNLSIQTEHVAIGKERGLLKMRWHGPFLEVIGKDDAEHDEEVSMISIDEWVIENQVHPDIIKIDIEGGEYDALLGAQNYLVKHKPILCIEIHTQLLQEQGYSDQQVFDLLHEMGYTKVYSVDGNLVDQKPELYFKGSGSYRIYTI